jgi:lytic murein transglycosylase
MRRIVDLPFGPSKPMHRSILLQAVIAAVIAAVVAPAHAQENFAQCLASLRGEAARSGVSGAAFDQYTKGVVADESVIALMDDQPEFKTPIWDYLATLVDDERVTDGRARLDQWKDTLAKVAERYGVDAATVVAVWGVESDFGRSFGKRPLVTSLATLSCMGRRQTYFRGELFAALKILERGDVREDAMRGSWAGAFGHTQFMPSTYLRTAVDFDGDGKRDLVESIPDALASTANYLVRAGWKSGQPWGFEVKLPAGFEAAATGRRNKRALAEWGARGVKRADGAPLVSNGASGDASVAILLPAGASGPAFAVFSNFDAIYAYNAAESYALAIAHLADRLRGGAAGFATAWPTDDAGLSRAERRELQTLLAKRGHVIGDIDGRLGPASRTAIKAEQQRLGQAADGRAGQKLLKALRG